MIKTIELKGSIGRLLHKEPFLMPDKLQFDFKHIGYDLSNAFIVLRNGDITITEKLTKPYIVPKQVLFSGDLHIKIEMYLGEKKAKEWSICPLRIKETRPGLVINDLLYELDKKVTNIVDKDTFNKLLTIVNELIEKHNKLAETVSELKEN